MATEKNLYSKLLQLFKKHLLHKYFGDLYYFKHSCDARGCRWGLRALNICVLRMTLTLTLRWSWTNLQDPFCEPRRIDEHFDIQKSAFTRSDYGSIFLWHKQFHYVAIPARDVCRCIYSQKSGFRLHHVCRGWIQHCLKLILILCFS